MNDDSPKKAASKKRKRFTRKKLIVIVVVILIFMAGVIGGWIYNSNQISETDKIAAQNTKRTDVVNKADDDAWKIIYNGGSVSDAALIYDTAIKASVNDPELKKSLFLGKTLLYFNEGNYDEALVIAKDLEAIEKNYNIEQTIASIYEQKGDKQNAIKYYKNAIPLIDKSSSRFGEEVKYCQNRIDVLSGTSD